MRLLGYLSGHGQQATPNEATAQGERGLTANFHTKNSQTKNL